MATIFPTSPAPQVNDVYQGYRYNGTSWDIIGVDLTVDYQPRVASVSNTELGYLDGVTSAVQTQLNSKSPLASPTFTGTVTIPAGASISGYATETYVGTAITNLIDAAPASLDTLNELAAALGDDANYASTITTALGTKAPLESPTFTGTASAPILKVTNSSGAEGGEIELAAPATSSTINTGVVIDVQSNLFRVFEKGGTNRGVSLDITSLRNGVNTGIATTDYKLNVIAAKTGAYTVASGDQGDLIELNGTFTVSIPTDATFDFAIGTQINLLNIGTGVITVAAVTPGTTTLNGTPGLKLRAQWSSATIIKRAANTWVIVGDLTA